MSSTTKQANFLLPEDLLDDLRNTVPARQQSKVVSEALRKELKHIKLEKSLQTSFGSWKDKDHPELKKGMDAHIRSMRRSTRMKAAK